MDKKFIMLRQGKEFVLYAGVLDLAHQNGLIGIETHIVQTPEADNGQTAIVTATARLMQADTVKVFTGIGDASPKNVAPAMQTCLLRMAETRAKARALRDAVNIGVAAFEELGEDDDGQRAENEAVRPVQRGYAKPAETSSNKEAAPAPAPKAELSAEAAAARLFKRAREEAGVTFTPSLLEEVLNLKPGCGQDCYDDDGRLKLAQLSVAEFTILTAYCTEKRKQKEAAQGMAQEKLPAMPPTLTMVEHTPDAAIDDAKRTMEAISR